MLELKNDRLSFHFPEIHPDARVDVIFHRTLRIPDDGRTYPLPPSLGAFPVAHVDDYKSKVPEKWVKHGGVMLPMWQSEAMWLQFQAHHVPGHGHVWPFAIKVSTGKRSAVTGKPWTKTLREGDYLVIPEQRWLDGYVVEDGVIRQFVAAPLGMGVTAEEQITGKAEFGGLQIEVFPMSCAEYMRRWPQLPPSAGRHYMLRSKGIGPSVYGVPSAYSETTLGSDSFTEISDCSLSEDAPAAVYTCNASFSAGPAAAAVPDLYSSNSVNMVDASRSVRIGDVSPQVVIRPDMGLAPGGRMAQQVLADAYGLDAWDKSAHDRCFVHLSNSLAWKAITGKDAPTIPLSAADYSKHGFPWFTTYSEQPTSHGSTATKNLKSVVQMAAQGGQPIVLENESTNPNHVVNIPPNTVRDGRWT